MRVREVVVVYDVGCPSCSRIARELPALLRVPVTVRSCRDPHLAVLYPRLSASVRACATPALGTMRRDGSVRWWPGLSGAWGVLPVVRLGGLWEAVSLLRTAFRDRSDTMRAGLRHRTSAADHAGAGPEACGGLRD